MTFPKFASLHGVSAQAVSKVAAAGRLDPYVRWETRGKLRFGTIPDAHFQQASKLWRSRPGAKPAAASPSGEESAPGGDPSDGIMTARRQREEFRAKREQLDYEVAAGRMIDKARAIALFGRQNAEVRNAVMALGKLARGRLPHLSVGDVLVIESLCRECLEGLSAGELGA